MALLLVAASAVGAFAASRTWEEFVAREANRERISTSGVAVLNDVRKSAPQGTEYEIWQQLWSGDARSRAAAGVALVDRMFPNGDPSRWEEVNGILPERSFQPRQLMAMDGLFCAMSALKELPDGVYASAFLLEQFGKSSRGKLIFIDDTPAEARKIIDDVVAGAGLIKDYWTSSKVRGHMPFLGTYQGTITRNLAESRQMQFLDGFGGVSGNGSYAWDRDRGYLFQVREDCDFGRRSALLGF